MNITNNQIKFIRSLHQSKFRQIYKKFIAEGHKVAIELIKSNKFQVYGIFCTQMWYDEHIQILKPIADLVFITDNERMEQITTLKNATPVLVVLYQTENNFRSIPLHPGHYFYLDKIQDPGNVGTIIRIADWFGFAGVIAGEGTADFFHPKVVQSSMASIAGIALINATVDQLKTYLPMYIFYALDMNGKNHNTISFNQKSIFILGNEGHGLSDEIKSMLTSENYLAIEGNNGSIAESLNVSIAAGIIANKTFTK